MKDIQKHIETYKKYLNIPNATKEDIAFFSQYCQRTHLDPVSRQIYAISYSEKKSGRQRIQVLLSIDGYRIIAQRTGEFEGVETFWCGDDGIWKDVWLEKKNPRASKVIVYKKGANKGISAVALFEEYANMDSPIWKKMPALMIAKCAESLALRKAFPSALSGLYTTEEMSNSEINNKIAETNKAIESIDNSQYDTNTNTYINYDICPSGNNKGKLWKDLDIKTLDKALQYYKEKNEENYSNIIEKILLEKIEREKMKDRETISVSEDEDVYNEEDEYMFGDDEDEINENDIIDFGEGGETK